MSWFAGPYRVLPGVSSFVEHRRIAPGEVMLHRSGAILTACPACGGTVQIIGRLFPPNDAPSIDVVAVCGARCRGCTAVFTIVSGRAVPAERPVPPDPMKRVPRRLQEAGVRAPPHLPDQTS